MWLFFPEGEAIAEALGRPERLHAFPLRRRGGLLNARSAPLRYLGKWLSVRDAVRSAERARGARCELAFFMFLDEFLVSRLPPAVLDTLFPTPWGGIYMQPLYRWRAEPFGRRRGLASRDQLLRSKRFRGTMPLDEAAAPWLEARFGRPAPPMPEYGDFAAPDLDDPLVAELRAFARGRSVVGAYGALAKRKGVLDLLRAGSRIADASVCFALAGKLDESSFSASELDEFHARIRELGDRCFYRPGRVASDAAFSGLVASSGALYLAYEAWPYSSGLQSVAVEANVCSVVPEAGIMGDRAREYGTGPTVASADPDLVAGAVLEAVRTKPDPDGRARYRARHNEAEFRRTIVGFCEAAARYTGAPSTR